MGQFYHVILIGRQYCPIYMTNQGHTMSELADEEEALNLSAD